MTNLTTTQQEIVNQLVDLFTQSNLNTAQKPLTALQIARQQVMEEERKIIEEKNNLHANRLIAREYANMLCDYINEQSEGMISGIRIEEFIKYGRNYVSIYGDCVYLNSNKNKYTRNTCIFTFESTTTLGKIILSANGNYFDLSVNSFYSMIENDNDIKDWIVDRCSDVILYSHYPSAE